MKISDALNLGNKELSNGNIDNCFYESKVLLSNVIGETKEWLEIHCMEEIDDKKINKFNEYLKLRLQGMPLQYILGSCGFMGNDFFVNKDVLIPRADTEVLVEEIINTVSGQENINILDLCTGSGCIAVSLKKALRSSKVTGSDISEAALDVARRNALHNNTEVEFVQSDLFSNLKGRKFNVIVSNPPYIPTKDLLILQPEVKHEPEIALDGGNDGLDFYREITRKAHDFLERDGYLAFEIGYTQLDSVKDILIKENFKIYKIIKDYSGNYRAILSKEGDNDE